MERIRPNHQASQTSMENPNTDLRYAHRAKPFSNELELHLTARELTAERGKSRQVFPIGRLERIRLSFTPRNTARLAFTCEVRAEDGKSVKFDNISWKSLIETERHDEEFRTFILALVARAARAKPGTKLEAGIAPLRYRVMQLLGIFIVAALAGAAIFAGSHSSYIVALASLGLTVYLANWLREFLTRNHPRSFTASTVPENVLPQITPPKP